MLEFGEKIEGAVYVDRPSAYAIIRSQKGEFAFAEVKGRYFLPGGGIDPGESPEEAVIREAREEIGAEIKLVRVVGVFVSYANENKNGEALYRRKIGTYFEAELITIKGSGVEVDHKLAWLSPEEITLGITPQAHVWAVKKASRFK
jgi:8-oxo-dGTP diphosphatase